MKITALYKMFIVSISMCAMLAVGGCDDEKNKKTKPAGISKEFKGPGGIVTLSTDRKEITIAQPLILTISANAKDDWEIKFPEFKDKLGKFTVRSFKELPVALSDDGKNQTVQAVAVLEPYLAGEYTIPPMSIKFINPEKTAYDTNTSEIVINVSAVIPASEEKPALRDITSVTELLFRIEVWMIVVAALVLAAIVTLIIILIKRSRNDGQEEIVLLAHEIALGELERLMESNLLKNNQIKEFYLKMSDILRHYIEKRFSIAAPERTTEEFLEELRNDPALENEHKSLLKKFLRHCDLVKFARHQPTRSDIDNSVTSCRNFIEETIPVPQEPDMAEQIRQG